MIEATVIRYISETLNTNDVYAERPTTPPEEYYVIERTGSAETNLVRRATLAVQSISRSSLLRAAEMNEELLRILPDIVRTEPNIGRCRLNSAYNFTNTETHEYRYQAVFDIYYMEGD